MKARPLQGARLYAGQALVCAVVLVAWEAGVRLGWIDPSLLPPPSEVAQHVARLPLEAGFWVALGRTLASALLGLLAATLIGVPAGIAIGANSAIYRSTRLLVDMGRSFPVVALMPVMVLLLGTTPRMLVVVATLATVWPILLQASYGARSIEPVVRDVARAFRIPARLRFTHVMLPTAAPFIATGIRIAATFALLVTIGVELLSATPGLGREIAQAQEGANFPLVMGYVFYCGLIGLAVSSALSRLERVLLAWHASAQEVR
ncbi:MAG: ABC transporter permease [Variovorax sp.]|nr:ABC transporter permease [Variovorax sp.]